MREDGDAREKNVSRLLGLGAKVLISVAALAYLGTRVDRDLLVETIAGADRDFILAAVLALALQPFLATIRWWELLRALDIRVGFGRLLQIVYVSLFFNQVLPASVGGDVIRVWLVRRDGHSLGKTVVSVFIDRAIMILILLILVASGYALLRRSLDVPGADLVAGAAVVTVLVTVALAILIGLKSECIGFVSPRLSQLVALPVRHLRLFLTHRRAVLSVSVFCLASHLNLILTVFLLMRAFNGATSVVVVAGLTPLVLMAATLPISFGGWGVRELAMVTAFAQLGIPEVATLSASLMLGILSIVTTLPGAVLFATFKRDRDLSSPMPESLQELEASQSP